VALTKYEVRVLGAAEQAESSRERLRQAGDRLGSQYFTSRADAGDLLAKFVFDVPNVLVQQTATGHELLEELRIVLPPELGARTVVSFGKWPDTEERRWTTVEHRKLERLAGGFDGETWSFRLTSSDGAEAHVLVRITGSAMAITAAHLPEATRLARDTGRTQRDRQGALVA
jgi:hypothetical protein